MSSAYETYKALSRGRDALFAADRSIFLALDLILSVDYEAYQAAGNLRAEMERFRMYLSGRQETAQARLDAELGALKAAEEASRG